MAKKIKKIKKHFKAKVIKDKCIANFIFQHLKKERIDLSKIIIPSFLDTLNNEENESKSFQKNIMDKNPEEPTIPKNKILPNLGFSFLNKDFDEEKEQKPYVFKSSIFK